MPWNGSGVFSRTNGVSSGSTVWEQAEAADRDIRADDQDAHDQDMAEGIENCLTRDGQNSPTQNLPMNAKKHTGVADASADDQYAAWGQVKTRTGDQVSSAEKTAGTETGIKRFSPKDVHDMVDAHAPSPPSPPNASTSTRGLIEVATLTEVRSGIDTARAVTAQGVRDQVGAQVSDAEKTAGTETAIRRFSPDDVADMIDRHASVGTVADAASIAWDVRANPFGSATLAGNRTLADPSNAREGGVYDFEAIQDATGNRTLAYDSGYSFGEEGAPVLSSGANKRDYLTFIYRNSKMNLIGFSKGH